MEKNSSGRIMAIDYGLARTGLAITDPLKIISYPLTTVKPRELFKYLDKYFKKGDVSIIVVGYPESYNNENTIKEDILNLFNTLKGKYIDKEVVLYNERYTSKIGNYYLLNSGVNKKKRSEKGVLDKISASVILDSYLNYLKNQKDKEKKCIDNC